MSEMLLTAYNGAILGPIAKFLGWIMNGMYILMEKVGISNVGLSIILFTIVIYLLMFPLTYKQQKFSKLSQKMNPELQAIQKKYKDKKDPTSMQNYQTETQLVYEKYGVSPTGSCVQMLIQMPLLFALYRVFMNVPAYISSDVYSGLVSDIMATSGYQDIMTQLVTDLNMRTVQVDFTATDATTLQNYIVDVLYKISSTGWDTLRDAFPSLTDSINSTYEVVSHVNNFIGLNISDTPMQIIKTGFSSGAYLMAIIAILIPVISYLTQVLNIKLMPTAAGGGDNDQMAQQMKMMNRTMPLFSLIMCFTVPVGLGIYWIASAVVRSIQQFFLNKHFDKINLEDIIAKNQEKAKKKREKMGLSENQISNAARMNTRQVTASQKSSVKTTAEKELELEKANAVKANAKPGSMAAKANMVREFNERNNKKN